MRANVCARLVIEHHQINSYTMYANKLYNYVTALFVYKEMICPRAVFGTD